MLSPTHKVSFVGLRRRLWSVSFALAFGASHAPAQWIDSFDTYQNGALAAQSNWQEWIGSSGVDATVIDSMVFAGKHALRLETTSGQPGDDVVRDFADFPGGHPSRGYWIGTVRTYFSSSATGTGFVVWMNQYGAQLHWSVQVRFDTAAKKVQNDGIDFGELPLVLDAWRPLYALVDLDADRLDLYYGGEALIRDASWKDQRSSGGIDEIAALDLYAGENPGGVRSMLVDQVQLEETIGPPCLLYAEPSPALPGDRITLKAVGPTYPTNTPGVLFSWTVNGTPFLLPLLRLRFDQNGEWTASADLSPGVGGLDIGFKVLALVPGEKPSLSNLELLVVQ